MKRVYKVVFGSLDDVEKEVNRLLGEGYLPCGNLVVIAGATRIAYAQPMLKGGAE